jgi:hypothetical protein
MSKTIKFDVWMDTGVTVAVPAGTEPNTPEGLEVIKAAAVEKFRLLMDGTNGDSFDVQVEPFGDDDE